MAQNPKPTTVAIVAADAEFARNAADGARENAKKAGLKIVYDKSYPPATTDFAPIVRAIAATNPDIVVDRAPIRRIRSAWCARSTRSASSRR